MYVLQNALLDLLGGTDLNLAPIKVVNANTITSNNSNTMMPSSNSQDLLDLLGGIDLSAPVLSTTTTTITPNNDNTLNGNMMFTTPSIMSMSPVVVTPFISTVGGGDGNISLFDDLSQIENQQQPSPFIQQTNNIKLTALDKNGLSIILVPQKMAGGCLQVLMTATNSSLQTIEQFLFQAAVPKSFTLQMLSPSGSVLPPGGTITQEMRLTNSAKVSQMIFVIIIFEQWNEICKN